MKTIFNLRYLFLNYGCAFLLIVMLLIIVQIKFLAYFNLFLVLGGLLTHYHLTNLFRFRLTVLSFILNFILWTAEQVNIESTYYRTPLYQSTDYRYLVVLLGVLLWVTNKVIIDFIFILFKAQPKEMHVEQLIRKFRNTQADT